MFHTPPPAAEDRAVLVTRDLGPQPASKRLPLPRPGGRVALLESAGPVETGSRWSVLGLDPVASFVSRGGLNRFRREDGDATRAWSEEPLPALRRVLASFPGVDPWDDLPFGCGALGYFSYELGRRILPIDPRAEDDLGLPDISLTFHECCLLHDRSEGRAFITAYGRGKDRETARHAAESKLEHHTVEAKALLGRRETGDLESWIEPGDASPAPAVALDEPAYRRTVQRCREEILDGNAYELCLTTRFESPFHGDPWTLYRTLRRENPAPFAVYLQHPELTLVGSSPERFLKLGADGRVEARPIKGTSRRGRDTGEDDALRRALLASEKDRAENVMIVDLLRNDLSRVCVPGTVQVPALCALETHPSVFQLVSTIEGRLRPDRDRLDLLAATFPGGSMTGAPKIAAMNLLEHMEPRVRGVYSGAAGYLGFDGGMDLSIVIRSIQIIGERAIVGAGGAVVFDSDPLGEWREVLDKARAPLKALAACSASARLARRSAVARV